MNSVVVAKFGGSVIGVDGISIPIIIQRINSLSKNAKVVAVFSAPLTVVEEKRRSLTDIALELGKRAEEGKAFDLIILRKTYEKILELVSSEFQEKCRTTIDDCLDVVRIELEKAMEKKEFADEGRSILSNLLCLKFHRHLTILIYLKRKPVCLIPHQFHLMLCSNF